MPRFTADFLVIADEILSRYPVKKSALIPLLHLAQEQAGYVSEEAMQHVAELVEVTPAEVLGTCSFYEMFKREPIGKFLVNICTNISCQLLGAEELLHHAERTLQIKPGGTTADGLFTLEDVECLAACTEAPCLQVNYRYLNKVSPADFDQLISDLRTDTRRNIPLHGTLGRVRQHIPDDRRAGNVAPDDNSAPAWLADGALS
ncbi:MAG TPA: NAD(P)H-dependent oxidoreductase subunit E [Acidimicrobiales bacterium]|nr:NAD(P)H-dependent oxidoreductase subunit E [Acidimicrobiales bacterium]